MLRIRFVLVASSLGLMLLGTGVTSGQDYPNKPIRIVTSGAGGGGDFVSRQIAEGISGSLGQPVIVENRGSNALAAEAASKAPPDGYTLYVTGTGLWILPLLQKAPFDITDFSPISLISRNVGVLVVHPSLPVKSVRELIALAKARPGELNVASGAPGSGSHLAAELFKGMAGVNIVRVPYKGAATAIPAVISGELQLTIYDTGLVAPHVKSGKLKALAVTSSTPSALFPDLPTVAETMAGYESVGSTGIVVPAKTPAAIVVPAKTPAAIVRRLNPEIVRFLNQPGVKQRFLDNGEEVVGSSPEQFTAIIKSDTARISKLIKDAGIKAD